MNCIRALLLFLFAAPLLAFAQLYPSKPIRLVVPYPPGGGLDLFARPLAHKVTELVGQPVVVENKPGASGVVGAATGHSGPTAIRCCSPRRESCSVCVEELPSQREGLTPYLRRGTINVVGCIPSCRSSRSRSWSTTQNATPGSSSTSQGATKFAAPRRAGEQHERHRCCKFVQGGEGRTICSAAPRAYGIFWCIHGHAATVRQLRRSRAEAGRASIARKMPQAQAGLAGVAMPDSGSI